jgi:ParB-like chromosome segregation protein Spo0J
MKQHPLSAAFPAMSADEYQSLKDSISNAGVLNPITTFEGMVLDGWNRYSAANELGMDCPSVDLDGHDPQDFVIAQNKARRHITQGQIAAAVVAVYQWRPLGANQHGGSAPGADPKSTKQLAEIAGVGARTIERAKEVEAKATPEVKAAVKSGAMSVKKAAETVKPPKSNFTAPAANDSHELAEANEAIHTLSTELDEARTKLAIENMDATPEEKAEAANTIADLRAEIKTLNAELDAMRISRDSLQRTNAELMKQVSLNAKELKKARA